MARTLLLLVACISMLTASAGPVLNIDVRNATANVSPDLWGIFFEEINHAGVGGLYAERIQNSGFETMLTTYAPWASLPLTVNQAEVKLSLSQDDPVTWQNPTSLRVDSMVSSGQIQTVAIQNPGYWGVSTVGVPSFDVSLFAASSSISAVTVSITNADGTLVYGSTVLSGIAPGWSKLQGKIAINTSDPSAVFVIQWKTTQTDDTIFFDVVSCLPSTGWRGQKHIRADIADRIADIQPAFVRFPGGCYVEGDSLTDRFSWKKALGPMEQRQGHWNLWGYHSEDGLGLFEYLSFIEQLKDPYGNPTRAVWVVSSGDSHTSHVQPDQLGPWIDEALQSIEFAMGDATTTEWGRKRAVMGHPAPFSIDYVAIGNEGNFYDDLYKPNYVALYHAIKKAYPNISLIANDYWNDVPIDVYDYHMYQTSEWFYDNQHTFDQYDRRVKIFNSEYAVTTGAGRGNLDAALGEAAWMTGLERNSDVVILASYAPLLVNDNDQRWDPDAIVFNSSFSYGTPSYWTQVMFSGSFSGLKSGSVQSLSYELLGATNISVAVTGGKLSATKHRALAASDVAYIIKLVNALDVNQNVSINLMNLHHDSRVSSMVDLTVLTTRGDSKQDENSFAKPLLVSPVHKQLKVTGSSFTVNLPRWSIVVARIYSTSFSRHEKRIVHM